VADVHTKPVAGTTRSNLADVTRRRAITGPCAVSFEPAFRAIYATRYGTPS
jgi:hypothetical protein